MTSVVDGTEYGFPAPAEQDITEAGIIARARAIAGQLVERQGETEGRAHYAEDIHETFADAGLYRIMVPRRYGGYEFGIGTFLRVAIALARGCPSTGWMYSLGAAHALVAATLFGEQAQAELFRGGDFICPATIVPAGTAERSPDGQWLLSGTWAYCSGAPYATHFLGHTMVTRPGAAEPEPMLFVAPRSQWRRLDDWGRQLGLKGTGSYSIVMDKARLPDYLTLPGTHMSETDVTCGTPGRTLHANPLYGGGQLSFMLLEIASLAVGMAQGALDAYEDLMRSRVTLLPPPVPRWHDPDYQRWYGEAAGMIATGEAAVLNAAQQWTDLSAEGAHAFTREQDLRIATICREVIRMCWRAVETHLFPTAGSSAVRHGERIERVWRDMSTLHSHSGVGVLLATVTTRDLARTRLAASAA
jgi:3-hydroxy-9,10-secoandrosta-1,3,5(10)-triene-9,17-dione monooxygenase